MAVEDAFTDRLSDYLDDEDLTADERAAITAHLAGCAACRGTLAELREVASRATSLTDVEPGADLWAPIAERIRQLQGNRIAAFRRAANRQRFTFTLPQLVAAGLALMILSGGAVWLARLGGPRTDFQPVDATDHSVDDARVTPANFGGGRYDQAIADLERTLEADRSSLDPETVRVLEENLQTIDRAIDQCRRALDADPANIYLNTHLVEAKKRKLALLRRASALANAQG